MSAHSQGWILWVPLLMNAALLLLGLTFLLVGRLDRGVVLLVIAFACLGAPGPLWGIAHVLELHEYEELLPLVIAG